MKLTRFLSFAKLYSCRGFINPTERLHNHCLFREEMADNQERSSQEPVLSKRAQRKQKRLIAKEKRKELKKLTKGLTNNKDPGFDRKYFEQAEYYFENGLRKVYPYYFTFSSFCKERWTGKTILDIFTKDFHGTDTDEYIAAIESGKVKVGGKTVSVDYQVKSHDFIEHTLHRHENPVVGTPLEIIHDDKDVVVINKPASIPCHPCGRYRFNTISFILGKEYGYANLRNIYRLDRLTSGVLILAKTPEKTRQLEDEVLRKHVQKEYVCRVVGEFPEEEITCDQPIDLISHKISMHKIGRKGKPSKTIFKKMSYNGKTSVVKCLPLTGRTHQIRVHLQYLGHPIINDPLYNSPAFGPNKGKGGDFWKSDAEITDEIQNLHNIGLWYDGENPLYHKRLREIKESKCSQSLQEEHNKSKLKDNPQSADVIDEILEENNVKSYSVDVNLEDQSEPESKRVKLDQDLEMAKENSKMLECSEKKDKKENEEVSTECINCNSGSDSSVNLSKNEEASSESSQSERKIVYNTFEESKWVPDETCTSCKRNYIDPSPSHLVMFLHALSYKGSDWEYRTDLPDWAKEDWIDDIETT